jgi:hypothetical protein
VRRRDPAAAAALAIAAAAAVLVAGGLLLAAVDALGATGWFVVVLAAAAAGVLAASGDPLRQALPAVLAAVAVGMAVGAVAHSRTSALDHAAETRFTQLWLVQRDSRGRTEIGVRNEERMPVAYILRLFGPRSQGGRPLVERTLELGPSQAWSQELTVPRTPRPERINAELYRLGEREPYRSAHIWTSP